MMRAIAGLKKKLGRGQAEQDDARLHLGHSTAPSAEGHGQAHDDESNWLVSYADMMTLLCGFFIMLFSMAKLDDPKFEKVKQAVAEHFGGEYRSPTRDLSKWVTQLLQDTPLKGEADVEIIEGGVAIAFKSQIFFETLSAEITAAGRSVLQELATALAERQKIEKRAYRFVIEGHTDARPVVGGSFATNWELSSARASRVVRVFIDSGHDPRRMAALGYADTRPVQEARRVDGSWDERALAENRRVVIRVIHDPEEDRTPAAVGLQGEASVQQTPEQILAAELAIARRSALRIREAFQSQQAAPAEQ
jgi:chemotaxis protein MotB